MVQVIKRDGRVEEFNADKISNAILKAMRETDKGEEIAIANKIANEISTIEKTLSVEEIQDLVERKLMVSSHKEAAKKYIRYRYLHNMARSKYNDLISAISEKLTASNVQNQNANVDEYSFGGRMGEANDIVMKQYALEYCMSKMSRDNHLNNEIYIHDLNSYAVGMHNCLSIPFDDLLKNGFNTRQTDVRGAQSINTAFQLVAVIFQIQSLQQFGGVSATHLDWTMVPYVRKSFFKHYKDGVKYISKKDIDYSFNNEMSIDDNDYKVYSPEAYQYAIDMTEREAKQAVEGMYHNLKY